MWGLEVQTQALRALVLLNGYPVFMPTDTGPRTTACKLNPQIIEGENLLQVRLGREADGAVLTPRADFELSVYHAPAGGPPGSKIGVARYEWEAGRDEIQPDGMTDLFEHCFDVEPDQAFGRWQWQDAVVFEEGERVAIETLVGKCRAALADRKVDDLLALMSLYAVEMSTALGVPVEEAEQELREYLQPYFADDRWEMAPLDYGALPLMPVCGGRIVLVMAPGGGPVLRGQIRVEEDEEPPLPPLGMEVSVSNLGGTWTVVR
jgi:hypothetical protein